MSIKLRVVILRKDCIDAMVIQHHRRTDGLERISLPHSDRVSVEIYLRGVFLFVFIHYVMI